MKYLYLSKIKWIVLSLCVTGFILYLHFLLTVNILPTVDFELPTSSLSEDIFNRSLQVKLSNKSLHTISVDYIITNSTNHNNNLANSKKEHPLQQGTLIFVPGTTSQSLFFTKINDSILATNKTITIQLLHPKNAILGQNSSHTLTILDHTQDLIVDVIKDFGATGDGITDDTKAIQTAINTVYQQGGGVISFPPGIYLVTSVNLKENIIYQGNNATIKRPNNQGKWTRTFNAEYAGKTDSKPLIIKGLTFDGNHLNQGAYKQYELEQAHLIFLAADPNFPGRLKVLIEDCTFKNGVADGISVYTNVVIKVLRCKAIDVFRGGFVLTGGNSIAEVEDLTTSGTTDSTGIDIEVDGKGYGNTLKVDVKLEKLNLINGDFDIAVKDDSQIIGNNITSDDAPFYIFSLDSTLKFTNSRFKVGAADSYMNRIVFPHNLTFENCEFLVTRKETGRPYDFFSAADVWWQHPSYKTQKNQVLTFNNCTFEIDDNIKEADTTYAIYLREDEKDNNNRLVINKGNFSQEFTKAILQK